MAANDALKFAVQIVEDDKKNVESLVKKIQLVLDKEFKLKVSDEGAAHQLEGILSVLKQIQQEMGNLSGHLGKDTWGKLSHNTQDAIVSINKLASELEHLDTKFAKTMGKAMGTAWAKEMKKGVQETKEVGDAAKKAAKDEAELGTAITATSQKVNDLAASMSRMKHESSRSNGGGFLEDIRSWEKAGSVMADLEKRMRQIRSEMDSGMRLGTNTGELAKIGEYYTKLYSLLEQVRAGGGYAQIPNYGMVNTRDILANGDYNRNTKIYNQELESIHKVNAEMERLIALRNQLTGISQGSGNKNRAAEISSMIGGVDELMNKLRSASRTDAASLFNAAYQKQVGEYEQAAKNIANEEKAVVEGAKKAEKAIGDLTTQINYLQGLTQKAGAISGFSQAEIDKVNGLIERLKTYRDYLESIKGSGKGVDAYLSSPAYAANYQQTRQAGDSINAAMRVQIEQNRQNRESIKEDAALAKSKNEAAKAVDEFGRRIIEVDGIIARMRGLKLDTSNIEKARQQLEALKNEAEKAASFYRTSGGHLWGEFRGNAGTVSTERDIKETMNSANQSIREQERALNENKKKKDDNRGATERLTAEERKLAKAMKQTTQQGFLQTNVLNDLKSMATQYLSVWGASSFVQTMAQITGELELQQKSLEVIIGSASYASQLFGEIRDLSQQSPYTFQDLLKSTRQLAAFGIETKDLYGTMKALSDIGAGLSVDVQRLILAYGHTKSYGYLSGIQNRQFETAGIDLVGALADRYNKLADAEERAGRAAEHVTRKDVFKMISKKEVGFEDVNAVIMGLDAPGGRFYNMQERQFETLGGKLRNLRNNYNIMMAETGKANHGMLMSGVNMLNELTEHWDKYARIITAILMPIGALKIANMALNTSIGLQTSAMSKNVMAMVRSEQTMAAMNAAAAKRGLFSPLAAIGAGWNMQGAFNPNIKDARSFTKALRNGLGNGSLTKTDLMYMGLSGNMPELYRRISLALAGVRGEQMRLMASSNGLQRVWRKLSMSAASLGASLRSLFAATLANPMAWIMAAVGGFTYLWQRASSMSSQVEELAKNQREQAENDRKEAENLMQENIYKAGVEKMATGDVRYSGGYAIQSYRLDFSQLSSDRKELERFMEEIQLKLQAMSPLYRGDLYDIYKFKEQEEQFKEMAERMRRIEYAREVDLATSNVVESGLKETIDGWWIFKSDGLLEDITDFKESLHKSLTAVEKLTQEDVAKISKALGGGYDKQGIRNLALSGLLGKGETANTLLKKNGYLNNKTSLSNNDLLLGYLFSASTGSFNSVGSSKGTRAQLGEMESEFKEFATTIKKIIDDNFKDDSAGAAVWLEGLFQRINTQAGVTDPETQHIIIAAAVKAMRQQVGKNGSAAFDEMLRNMVKNQFMSNMENQLTGRETAEEQEKILNRVSEQTIKWGESLGIDMKRIGMNVAESYRDGFNSAWNQIKQLKTWQKNLLYVGGDPTGADTAAGALFGKEIKDATSYQQLFGVDLKKRWDELNKNIQAGLPDINKTIGINIDTKIQFSYKNLGKLKEIRTKLENYLEQQVGPISEAERERYADYIKDLKAQETLITFAHEAGYDYEDDKSKGKGGGRGTYKDREYELWEQRVKIIQEARREYEYWEKAVGKESAQDKVKKQFEELISKSEDLKKALKPGDLDDLEHYRKVLADVQKEATARYERNLRTPEGKRSDKQKVQLANDQKILREIAKTLNDIDKMEFEKATEEFVSGMSRALEDLSRRWDIFNTIREKIGNDAVSMRIAGFTPTDSNATFRSDAMRQSIQDYMAQNASAVGALDFGKLLGMDEKSLKTEIDNMFRVYTEGLYNTIADQKSSAEEVENAKKKLSDYETQIKAVVDALKEWQEAETDTSKEAVLAYAEVLGKAVDYESEVRRIDTAAKKQKDLIDKARADVYDENGNLVRKGLSDTEVAKANGMVDAEAESKKWKLSVQYLNLMNGAMALTRAELSDGINKAMEDLDRLWKNNLINAGDYATEMEKLHKMQRDYEQDGVVFGNEAFGAFAKGGVNGAVGWLDTAITNRIAELQKAGIYKIDENGKYIGDDERLNKLLGNRTKWESAQKGLTGVADVSQLVMGALSGLQGAAEELSKMFDSLGNERMANKFGDIADGIGGVMSGLDGISGVVQSAMSGDLGGLISNALQAPIKLFTGPIAAFSALHDKKRERHIERIGKEITKISNTLDTIRDLREQELGYATGNNIRAIASQYRTQAAANESQIDALRKSGSLRDWSSSARLKREGRVISAMAEYYGRATGGTDSSYAMEYNLLLDERKKKMEQYNEEAAKKKKDDGKLEEYKKEIAELDAQVQQFAENLMNELWGIDFKGWASQISDALMTAFENGTSMAEAFDDSVNDILRNMAKNMQKLAIIEPFMNQIKKEVLGYTDEQGVYHAGKVDTQSEELINNPKKFAATLATGLMDSFNKYDEAITVASQEFLTGYNDAAKQYGWDITNKGKSGNSGSNSITQSITEETAGYMTGILAAMHQDGSVRRLQLQMLVGEQMPSVIEMMTVSGGHIAGIDENTRAIMRMMQDGSGRMYERINYIGTKLDRFANGTDRVTLS